jgi:hypothetical protein
MAKSYHFRVGNGDMALVETEEGRRILIDINIRAAADDEDDETPDVASQLRDLLTRDDSDRLYVDAFLLTHPDCDHIGGLQNHFHLGKLADWSKKDDKIVIREMWSSPMIFRRRSNNHKLVEDAHAWACEARRRVALFKENGSLDEGDRILVLGEDIDSKTDDLDGILIRTGDRFSTIDGVADATFSALLLAPMPPGDEEDEETFSKNNSSVIVQLTLDVEGKADAARYLFGGDAEVAIWERLWADHKSATDNLAYDVLIAPHHCSWHSLSWDSWSKLGEDAEVSSEARDALGQARSGALVLASCCPIEDDNNDPPCIRAKREYEDMLSDAGGEFRCIADEDGDEPVVIEIGTKGTLIKRAALAASAAAATGVGTEALPHG